MFGGVWGDWTAWSISGGAGPRGSQTARLPCCVVPRYTGTLFLRFGTSSCSECSQHLADEIEAFRLFLEQEGSSEEALKSRPVGLSGHSCGSSWDGDAPAPGSGQIQPRLDARGQARTEDSHLLPESQGSKGGGRALALGPLGAVAATHLSPGVSRAQPRGEGSLVALPAPSAD